METKQHSITLGSDVQDRHSDFKGVVHGVVFYLNGCVKYDVKPRELDKDGKAKDGYWVDEQSLIVLNAAEPRPVDEKKPGGPPERSLRQ